MANDFGLKIGLEGEKEFKKSLQEIDQSFKVLGSEMKLVDSQFDKNDRSVEALAARNGVLEKSIEAQKGKIELLRKALENASDSFGENDRRTQSWQIQLNRAQAELNKMERELKDNKSALGETTKGLDQSGKAADDYGKEVKKAGEKSDDASKKFEAVGKVCKAAAAAMAASLAAISAAAIAAGKALVDMSREGAQFADTVLTESTVTGISTEKLQEYMYAAELVDVSTETLTKSMTKQINSMKAARDGSKSMVEAYDKLGVSVTDSNGELRDSETVYWELIDALGKVENETERDSLAMTILGKSAQDLNPLITAGAQRMQELGKQAKDAGYVMGDDMLQAYGSLDDQCQKLTLGVTAAKNAVGAVLLPVLTSLASDGVSLLGEFTSGINEANGDMGKIGEVISSVLPKAVDAVLKHLPDLIELVLSILNAVGTALTDNVDKILEAVEMLISQSLQAAISALPKVAEAALKILMALVKICLDNQSKLINMAIQLVVTLARGIADAAPSLVPAVVGLVVGVVQTVLDNLPLILDVAIELVKGLVRGILDALPILIDALPQVIMSIVTFILDAIPLLIDTGIQLLSSIVADLPTILGKIVSIIPVIIQGVLDALFNALPQIIEAGVQLFIALVSNSAMIIKTILSIVPDLINSLLDLFTNNIGKFIEMGITLFTSLITDTPRIIWSIVSQIPSILTGIFEAFGKGVSKMGEIGGNLVKGLWEGIKSLAGWIKDKVSEWASGLWNGIKSFFGIHSPSTKMSWIGDMLMEGLANGIDESAEGVIDSVNEMRSDLNSVFNDLSADADGIQTDFTVTKNVEGIRDNGFGTGGITIQLNIDTFNNYSPEDIEQLTTEIMETAGNIVKRKEVVFA